MLTRIVGALLFGILWWVPVQGAWGQEVGATEDLGAFRDTLDLSKPHPFTLQSFVQPGSEKIYLDGAQLDSSAYRIDYRFGRLWLEDTNVDSSQTLIAVYRTWGFAFKDEYRRRSIIRTEEGIDSTGAVAVIEEQIGVQGGFDPFRGVQLQHSGSISRGILTGNNRDVTLESGLNLQLAGEVAEGINVQAVLTDENSPILPEGNTQRLSEFDRVFIQINAPQGTAQLGDFDVAYQASELARFSRKLQGITVFGDLPETSSPVMTGGTVSAAGATTRGIFRSQDIQVIDGVQGPYRLEGLSNEQFIIVVPGSEEVYVNGQLMTRGETNDYIIDYATGELTFSSRRLITEAQRVTVEFQYSTNQFTRSLVGSEVDVGLWRGEGGAARARFGATFLREADSRNFNEQFGVTAVEDSLLRVIGDSTVAVSGAVRVEYDPEALFVQYIKRDTLLIDNTIDTIFVAISETPAADEPVYRVQFTRVGSGNGKYNRVGRTVNGILYEYRGPGGGEYEPVRIIPKPKEQRLFDLRGGIEPLPGVELYGEWAQSLNNQNRLSEVSAGNNGTAYIGGLRVKPVPILFRDKDLGQVSLDFRRRFTGDRFATFDRTRPVEFARRWNLDSRRVASGGGTVQAGDETIDEGTFEYTVSPNSNFRAEIGRIQLSDTFTGSRQAIALRAGEAGFPRITYRLENILSTDELELERGTWLRQLGVIEQPLLQGRLTPRFELEQERRRQRVIDTDSLASPSRAFVEYRPGITWQSERYSLTGFVELRKEDLWAEGVLRDAQKAWTLQTDFTARPHRNFNTDGSVGYRIGRYTDYFRVNQKREDSESVVLRWNGRFRPLQQAVNLNWYYEALTEKSPELQEIYVRTGSELGEFVWEDTNGDGVIQIDEFIPERTQDEGTYIKTFIPSDSLTSVISLKARATLLLDPSKKWRRADEKWKRVLSKVSTRTSIQIQEKNKGPNIEEIYLLKLSRFRDPEHTLRGLLRINQDLQLFRNDPRYGALLSYSQIQNLSRLAAGAETRFVNLWRLEGTYRPTTGWGVRLLASLGQNRTDSESFESRRYDIDARTVEPEISFHPIRSLQFSTSLSFSQKEDQVGDRTSTIWKVPFMATFMHVRRLNLTGRFEMAHVNLSGEAKGLAQFELTDGRGEGTSFLWTVSGWYQISSLLRATFSYNGRSPSDAPTLHTVRAQLSAVF